MDIAFVNSEVTTLVLRLVAIFGECGLQLVAPRLRFPVEEVVFVHVVEQRVVLQRPELGVKAFCLGNLGARLTTYDQLKTCLMNQRETP